MTNQLYLPFVRTVPLFHSISQHHLEQVSADMTERSLAAGEIILCPDSDEAAIYVVLEGEFQIYQQREGLDLETDIGRLLPGDYFGILRVLASRPVDSWVRSLAPSRVLVLSQQSFDELLGKSTEFARAICESLVKYVEQSIVRLATIPFVELDSFEDLSRTAKMLPARICQLCQCLVVDRDDQRVTVAMVDPSNTQTRAFLVDALSEYAVDFVVISDADFQRHAQRVLGADRPVLAPDAAFELMTFTSQSGAVTDAVGSDASDALVRVLTQAIRVDASDIHLEPTEHGGRIRLRIDGRMVDIDDSLNSKTFKQSVNRIKVFAELDTTNIRLPQDGRFMVDADDRRVEFRVSMTPCMGGEKAVLRLISAHPSYDNLDNLILASPAAALAKDILLSPSGLVLVTGPTGAGKTTTLYAALKMIAARDRALNIVTIEDPVEYNLDFATQIQVNQSLGLDFDRILPTALRQDPDVILVGEVRDSESANIALEAATTGHLVLSSLHTDSAMETLVRLRNLGVKPYLLADALRGVITQKLLPRLHPGCTEAVPPDDPVRERLARLGILEEETTDTLLRGRDVDGGPAQGEHGRVGAFEILQVTPGLQDLIDRTAPRAEMEAALDKQHYCSFAAYCRFLLHEGLVAPKRVERIFPKR